MKYPADSVGRGLDKITGGKQSQEELISKLQSLRFDDFLKIILLLRKVCGLEDGIMPYDNVEEHTNLQRNITFLDDIIYLGPTNPYKELKAIYEKWMSTLSVDNIRDFALELYFAISLGQIFEEGNGRTALILYNYLTTGTITDIVNGFNHQNTNGKTHKNRIGDISIESMQVLFRSKGIISQEQKLAWHNIKNDNDIVVHVNYDENKVHGGVMTFIYFLTYHDVLGMDYDLDRKCQLDELDESQRNMYDERMGIYADMLFDANMVTVLAKRDELRGDISDNINNLLDIKTK